jgi:hypothetical protein
MNLSNPLWNTQNETPTSSITTNITQPLRQDSIQTEPLLLPNSFEEALASISSALVESPTMTFTTSPTASGDTFSQSQTDQIIAAITTAANGSYMWTFESFWYIAVIVTALTILLPLIAGPTFRATLRFSYNHKNYWRIAVFLIVLACLIILDIFIPPAIFLGIFGIPQGIIALWKLWQAEIYGKEKKRWAAYTTLLAVCVAIDLVPPGATVVTGFIHFGQNIGVTGFFPSLYLFIIWIQTDKPVFSTGQLLTWVEKVTPEKIKNWDSNLLYTKHPKTSKWLAIVFLEMVNVLFSIFLPGYIYLLAGSVPFGLYGIDRLICTRRDKFLKLKWAGFLIILGISIFMYTLTLLFILGRYFFYHVSGFLYTIR